MGRNVRDTGVTLLDYDKQPFPLFGVWSNYQNTSYGLGIYDSDMLPITHVSNANYSILGGGEIAANFAQTYTGQSSYPNITSYQPESYSMGVKGTCSHGVDGNGYLETTLDGSFSARNTNAVARQFAYFGVVVGPEGFRQNYSLYQNGYTFAQMMRGTYMALDRYVLTVADATLASATGTTTAVNGTSSQAVGQAGGGQIAYHRGLGKLFWLEPTGTAGRTYRLHVWRHPTRKLTGRLGELRAFIKEAKANTGGATYAYFDFDTGSGTGGGSLETNLRCRLIPTHVDGKLVLVRMIPGVSIERTVITTPTTGTTATVSAAATIAGTSGNMFGCDSGNHYGIRHQISWDNRWVAAFCQYYYYGSGIITFINSLDDPTLFYTVTSASSADAVQIYPIKSSAFIFGFSSVNADGGAGMAVGVIDLASGLQPDGVTPLVSGGSLSITSTSGILETYYTSTMYPCLVPVEKWAPMGVNLND